MALSTSTVPFSMPEAIETVYFATGAMTSYITLAVAVAPPASTAVQTAS